MDPVMIATPLQADSESIPDVDPHDAEMLLGNPAIACHSDKNGVVCTDEDPKEIT